MRVERPHDPSQRPVDGGASDRISRTEGTPRRTERAAPPAEAGDRVETEAAGELGRLMEQVRSRLEAQERDVLDRKEELLARVHDPAAVRRAAERVTRLLEQLRDD